MAMRKKHDTLHSSSPPILPLTTKSGYSVYSCSIYSKCYLTILRVYSQSSVAHVLTDW